jgi:hypothetical protein
MMDRKLSPVTQDKDFRPSIVYSTKSPFFRQGSPPIHSGYITFTPKRESFIEESEKESESDNDSESESDSDTEKDDPKSILGKR